MKRIIWWAFGFGVFALTLISGLNNLGTGKVEAGRELAETASGDPVLTDARRVSFFDPELLNELVRKKLEDNVPSDTLNSSAQDDGQILNVGSDLDPDEPMQSTDTAIRNVGEDLDPDEPMQSADTAVRNVRQDLDPDAPMDWVETEVRNVGDPGLKIDDVAVSTSMPNGYAGVINNTGDPNRRPED
jgi:hypothetical protein